MPAGAAGLVERLVDQADRCRQVEGIRAFIVVAAAAADYVAWRRWALAQAEAMAPLRDGLVPFARLPPLSEWVAPLRTTNNPAAPASQLPLKASSTLPLRRH